LPPRRKRKLSGPISFRPPVLSHSRADFFLP
jgi:hypothetical protein